VRELLERIDSDELSEWQAFASIEPFGPLHDELMAGQIAAVTANVHRDTKKRPEPFTAADFGPGLRGVERKPEPILLRDPEAHSNLLLARLFPEAAKKAGIEP
jgi:hypothetical protein